MAQEPPKAAKRISRVERHGEVTDDPYAWLRAENWREVMLDPQALDPDIRAYLEAENAYTKARLAPVEGLRKTLFAEMKARIKEDDSSVPARDGAYLYYRRFDTGGQHPIFCRRRGSETGPEEILVHGPEEAQARAFFRISSFRHSPDHRLGAYAVDLTGSETYTIRFRELATGQTLNERIEGAHGDLVWANDGRTLFYTVLDEAHRPSRVFRHTIGEDSANDDLIYEESDPAFFVGLSKTEDRQFVLIEAHDHAVTSEVRLIDADRPDQPPIMVAPRDSGVEYDVSSHGARLLIRTNADGAKDFKIVEAPRGNPRRENWRDLVGHRPGRLIRGLAVFADHLVRLERTDGLPRIAVSRLGDGEEHEIVFEEEAFDLGIVAGYEYATTTLRFTYSSLATPERTYDYDMEARDRGLRKEQEVPSGHDARAYVGRSLFAPAHDGERVPISVLYRKDTPLDGTAPLLLYGYGAYGLSIPAAFSSTRLSLVDRGFIHAVAHVRGGTDKGRRWYLDGKLTKKTNSFLDFIAAAEHLIAEGYTRAGNIAAQGGSAGGLLVGAVANMRPELFKAIVAEVPFVDVVNTISDGTLPLTPPEWTEWGNPIEDAKAYRTIRAYSPYDNVGPRAYPHILATAGLSDPRVTYWEPAKWVARLRALKTDDNLVVLRTNMEAGHAGASGRFDRLGEVALAYAFVLMVFGIEE